MKRLIAIAMLVVALVTGAAAESPLYKKCENVKGLTTVYITKQMLQMAATMNPAADQGAMTLLKDKLDNVMIVTSQNSKGVDYMNQLRNEISAKKGYEQLMRINDDNENVIIVQKPVTADKKEYVISVIGKGYATMIVLEGKLTLEDLSRLSKGLGDGPVIGRQASAS